VLDDAWKEGSSHGALVLGPLHGRSRSRVFGGDSKDHLKESFDDMARDLARFLTRLARGEVPRKE
jgi:hypothetical protein